MKMAVAYPRPQFSVDERVFMVLKDIETGNVLETIIRIERQFPNQRTPCRQTIMDNYKRYVQLWFKFEQERWQYWTSKDSTNSS